MAEMIEVTDDNLDTEVFGAAGPIILDFGAEWCAPCKQLDPIIEELATEWDGKIKVGKIDVDENVDTAMRFGVSGIPTVILLLDGEVKERFSGYRPKQKIVDQFGPYVEGQA